MPRTPLRLPLARRSGKPSKRGRFADTAIGTVHIDISELRLAEGKLTMVLAIDRVSKFTYVEFRDDAGKMNGADFLRGVVAAFPYAIHTVLTDNGMAFADLPRNRNGPTRRYLGAHIFDRVCAENAITHKLTKPYHPWTNGQAERTGRTVKDATIKTFHYPSLESLKAHVTALDSVSIGVQNWLIRSLGAGRRSRGCAWAHSVNLSEFMLSRVQAPSAPRACRPPGRAGASHP